MLKKTKNKLIPNISVGDVILGENIDKYRHHHHFYFKKDPDDLYMDDYYEFVELKLAAFVSENGIIHTVNCKEECYLQGKNLIGSTIAECITLVGKSPDDHDQIFILIDEKPVRIRTYMVLKIWDCKFGAGKT